MSTVAIYRGLVPGHTLVPDATVQTWLDLAVARHTYSAWGAAYDSAMVFWAASRIEPLRIAGQAGELTSTGSICQPAVDAEGKPIAPPKSEDTVYWGWYLEQRGSRAARAPTRVGVC